MKLKIWGQGLALALMGVCLVTPSAIAAEIDFEGLDEGAIPNEVSTGKGVSGPLSGTISVFAYNPSFESGTNAAVIFDSSCPPDGKPANCSGGDPDLGTPNQAHGGPGVGIGGTESNATALGKILIIGENLKDQDKNGLVDDPDDANLPGSYYNFDFSKVQGGMVTINSVTVVDIERGSDDLGANIILSGPNIPASTINVPRVGDNGVGVISDIGAEGVTNLRIDFDHSGGLASIVFNE